jgi:starch phosphorylase
MGLEATVFHMNEGHSAFLGLERIRHLMQARRLSFREARILASESLIFTTHTPVAAGHDYFPPALMERFFSGFMSQLGLGRSEFLALGRQDASNDAEAFCMTVLALRLASFSNGVSALHGRVSRAMWNGIWKGVPETEVPIGHVTNGVHFRSWVSYEMNQLYDRYLGPKWREEPADAKLWRAAETIPSLELWRTHERRRERLVTFTRERLRSQLVKRGVSQSALAAADEVLSPDVLTIGFGRRFASYKRATLLARDPERLGRLLNNPQRPVQVIFAGKAHPQDNLGKELIQTIVELANRPEFRHKIVFLENYDMEIARYVLQGCDVWLNTPLRPLEASGTSGMKAQVNGVLNLSTLDGWWDEAWLLGSTSGADVGWAIGHGETYSDAAYQDQVEAEALYELLEREIVPTFYDRRVDGVPAKWVARMKVSIARLCPEFNMHRMVRQYANEYYVQADHRYRSLSAEDARKTRELSAWLQRVESSWGRVAVESVEDGGSEVNLREHIQMSARVSLDKLTPQDVTVELLVGLVDSKGDILEPMVLPMQPSGQDASGSHVFRAILSPAVRSGLHGYAVRVLPAHPDAMKRLWPGLICWATCSPTRIDRASSVPAYSRAT